MPFRTHKGLRVRTGYTCILLTDFFVAPTPSIARAYMGLGVKNLFRGAPMPIWTYKGLGVIHRSFCVT